MRSLLVVVSCALHGSLAAQGSRLNPPLPPEVTGTALDYVVSADGSRVVYRAGQDRAAVFELYAASGDGSGAVLRLHPPLPANSDVQPDFRLDPGAGRVVYRADARVVGVLELHSVPSDASASPVRLHAALAASADVVAFAISPDSSRVAWLADAEADERFELYSAPLDGSLPAVRLSTTPVAGGDVHRLWITPDSARVLYLADALGDELDALFSVPLDGSAAAVRLSSSAASVRGRNDSPPSSLPLDPKISADSSRVVYVTSPGANALFSAPLDGSAPALAIGGSFVSGGLVTDFRLAPDSQRAVYLADQQIDGLPQLYSTPLATATGATRLNDPVGTAGERIGAFWVGASARVLYRASPQGSSAVGLFSRPIDASAPSVQLSPAASIDLMAEPISPDGTRVVYYDGALRVRVLDGSAPALTIGAVPADAYHADGLGVIGQLSQGGTIWTVEQDLYYAPLDGSTSEVHLLDGELGNELDDVRAAGGHLFLAVWRNLPDPRGRTAVRRVPLDGGAPTDVHPRLATGPSQQDVARFLTSPDGRHVVFTGDLRTDVDSELFSAPADGTGRPVRLADIGTDVAPIRLSGDSRRVLARVPRLSSLPIDGVGPVHELEPAPGPSDGPLELTPDGATILFQSGPFPYPLCVAPVDGSAAPLTLASPEVLVHLRASATHAVYAENVEERVLLFSVPLDGSSAPLLLNGLPHAGNTISAVRLAPDGTRLAYAQRSPSNVYELWSVPLDASAAPLRLDGPMVSGGAVSPSSEFAFSPDSTRVLYRADQEADNRFELYSVPSAGGPALRLNGTLPVGGDVTAGTQPGPQLSFRIAPDGLVLYRANGTLASRFDLYSVPFDGSAAPTRLTGAVPGAGDVMETFELDPAGDDVVFRYELAESSLHAVARGGGTPRRLSPDLAHQVFVHEFVFAPGGGSLVYVADQEASDSIPRLYHVPLSGARAARRVGGQHLGWVQVQALGAAGRGVVYLADREVDDVFELWRVPLERAAPDDVPPTVR